MKTIETAATNAVTSRTLMYLVAIPGVLFLIVTAVLVAGPAFGFDPIWYSEPLTLPEAAGLRDDGEIVRLIQNGADPNAPGTVRAGLVKSYALTLTPLEAAVGIRRADTVKLLLDHGAAMDASGWMRLVCFARQEHAPDVEALLVARHPAGTGTASCSGVKTPW